MPLSEIVGNEGLLANLSWVLVGKWFPCEDKMIPMHSTVKNALNNLSDKIGSVYDADCILFHGQILPGRIPFFGELLRDIKDEKTRLLIVLQTPGGSAEATEKMVEIIRHYYEEVYFVVPRYAMSAGTIFCMSGDKIIMDFESSLGPIDPQVFNGKDLVPAQGYLDQYEKLVQKSKDNTLSLGELQMLLATDLADLSRYEQAKNLTVTLLKKWLVQYKFKNWNTHESSSTKKGMPVTDEEKIKRAEEIAQRLGDNGHWHSHGRFIGPKTLWENLRLKIDTYPNNDIKGTILEYNDLAEEFMVQRNIPMFFHSKRFF